MSENGARPGYFKRAGVLFVVDEANIGFPGRLQWGDVRHRQPRLRLIRQLSLRQIGQRAQR